MTEKTFREVMQLIRQEELGFGINKKEAEKIVAARIFWSTRPPRYKRMWQHREARWRVDQALHQITITKVFEEKTLAKYEVNLLKRCQFYENTTALGLQMPVQTIRKAVKRAATSNRTQLPKMPVGRPKIQRKPKMGGSNQKPPGAGAC